MPEPPRSIHECEGSRLKIDLKTPRPLDYLLSDRIRGLFQTCQLFDMYLIVGDARFPAHQAVLAATSDWLRGNLEQLLQPQMEAGQWPEMRLQCISHPEAILALLDAAYGLGAERGIPQWALADVLRLSRVLQVPELEEQAVHSLAMEVTCDNVLERLDICVEFDLTFLYERILAHLHKQGQLVEVCKCQEMCCYPRLMQHLVLYLSTHDLK